MFAQLPKEHATRAAGNSSNAPGHSRQRPSMVVVGNGMVGHRFCEQLVLRGAHRHYRLHVFGEENTLPYNRIRLGELLSRGPAQDISLASRNWYEEHGIDLRLGDPIQAINRTSRLVTSEAGHSLPYDYLILATGSSPYLPPLQGVSGSRVLVYRTIADAQEILRCSSETSTVAILGGGFLSLELACALAPLNQQVHIVEMAPILLPRQIDAESSAVLTAKLEEQNVKVHLFRRSHRVEREPSGKLKLHFDDASFLRIDLLIVAAGVRPRDSIARSAGLRYGPFGGVIVNERLQSSDPRVFAIGECANFMGKIYGTLKPGYRMADTLASISAGRRKVSFQVPLLAFDLKVATVQISSIGHINLSNGAACAFSQLSPPNQPIYRKLIMEGSKLKGALWVGSWPERRKLEDALAKNKRIGRRRVHEFMERGYLWTDEEEVNVSALPAQALICHCFAVSKDQILQLASQGCRQTDEIKARTGASSNCGLCKPAIDELLHGKTNAPFITKTAAGTLCLAALAGFLASWIALRDPLPPRDSIAKLPHFIESFLADRIWREATGYSLLGVSAASLLLSWRRRVARARKGIDIQASRLWHMGLGSLALAILPLHTGFRLGTNWNFWLMSSFLSLSLMGSLAGLATAWQLSQKHQGLRWHRHRSFLIALHILLAWPLPVLLICHIFMAYYF